MVLDLFEKAIDRGIALLRERETRRANFFREVVEPVHAIYLKFKAEHVTTFNEVRGIVRDPSRSVEEARGLILEKERDERLSWMVFDRLGELATESHAKLTEAYSNYIQALRACLMSVSDESAIAITFYHGLEDELRDVVEQASAHVDRSWALKRIDGVLLKFQRYCTDVELAYLQLRKNSLV